MDYEKKYNEALAIAKETYETQPVYRAWLEKMFPELRESEDERIRKALIKEFEEKVQKSFEWKDGIPNNAVLAWLKKQKEACKAIEAVERIDKYIGEHLANAHDMKDYNPEKKYYCGWDDALGKMAGILQDVYSNEKQKDHFRDDTKKVEKQDYFSLNDLERAIHRGFLSAGLENAPVTLIKETAKECLEQMKPSEINVKALLSADRLASAEMTGRLKERNEILENP